MSLTLLFTVPLSAFLAGFPRLLPGEIAVISDYCDSTGERLVHIYSRLKAAA